MEKLANKDRKQCAVFKIQTFQTENTVSILFVCLWIMGNSYFIGLRLLNNWNVQSFSMNYRNLAHRQLFSRVRQIYYKNSMNLNKKTQLF